MKRNSIAKSVGVMSSLLAIILLVPTIANAHCDTMNGPVVKAAQKALETNNVNLVLIWVQKKDETAIKEAFAKTIAVRKSSPEGKALADMYFFETLVRVHRADEGVAYTGLKPAETEAEPGIEAADRAIQNGTVDNLVTDLSAEVEKGIRQEFARITSKKNFSKDNVEAGREYVDAYVVFIHYVERLYQAILRPSQGHYHESPSGDAHDVH